MASAEYALGLVSNLYRVLSGRRTEVDTLFDAFNGKQPLAYASDQWKAFHGERYRDFADNWCGVVGRSPVDRLRIDGVRVGDDPDDFSDVEKALWKDWQANDMEAKSSQGFLASTIAKRSATLVWADSDGNPVVTWEHPSQVAVDYDHMGNRRAGIKAWIEDGVEYATLYLPDEVWKFQRPSCGASAGQTKSGLILSGSALGGGDWQPRLVSGEVWPLPNPLGVVPLVEWQNRPMLGGEPLSDIAGTMAMQNATNLMWAYLFNSADQASMAARVVTGAEPPKVPILDETGQVIGSKPAKLEDLANGRLLFLPGVKGNTPSIDQWDAAKLDVFTDVIREAVGHIAAQTSTPGHYLLTNEKFANLNGDALTAAEVPLANKVRSAQSFYTPAAKETFRLMALVRDSKALANDLRSAHIQWKDAGMHTLSQVADAATKDRSVGLSLSTILRTRYGFTPAQVEDELARIRAERMDPTLMAIADAARANNDANAQVG